MPCGGEGAWSDMVCVGVVVDVELLSDIDYLDSFEHYCSDCQLFVAVDYRVMDDAVAVSINRCRRRCDRC